jgi:hypothetical protein
LFRIIVLTTTTTKTTTTKTTTTTTTVKTNLSKSCQLQDSADVSPTRGRELESAAREDGGQKLLQDGLKV